MHELQGCIELAIEKFIVIDYSTINHYGTDKCEKCKEKFKIGEVAKLIITNRGRNTRIRLYHEECWNKFLQ